MHVFFCDLVLRPLPHIVNGKKQFNATGNPVFARDLLVFADRKEECQKGYVALFTALCHSIEKCLSFVLEVCEFSTHIYSLYLINTYKILNN